MVLKLLKDSPSWLGMYGIRVKMCATAIWSIGTMKLSKLLQLRTLILFVFNKPKSLDKSILNNFFNLSKVLIITLQTQN